MMDWECFEGWSIEEGSTEGVGVKEGNVDGRSQLGVMEEVLMCFFKEMNF